MDGFTLLKELQQFIQETSTSTWATCKTGYDYLYQAAIATATRTGLFTSSQTVTTVANQANYTLNADFLRLYLIDASNRKFVKYYNGTTYSFPHYVPYDSIYISNNTTGVSVPIRFTIKDATPGTQISGTTTSAGALASSYTLFGQTLGESTLNNSGGGLSTVNIGDMVHNTTDASHGYVIALSASTAVVTALFDGTNNAFANSDAYKINLQHRYELYLDPPPSTSGHYVYVPYVKRPDCVYSAYRAYTFPVGFSSVLVHYAAWLYKYRDKEPSYGDGFYQYWDYNCSVLENTIRQSKTSDWTYKNKQIMDSMKVQQESKQKGG